MGSIATSKSQDLRTVAELQEGVLAGPEAVVAYPGAIVLEAEAFSTVTFSPTITQGADKAAVEKLLSNKDSTIGKLLGINEQLAGGIFESSGDIIESIQAQSRESTEKMLSMFGSVAKPPPIPSGVAEPGKLDVKVVLIGLGVGIALLAFLRR